MMDDLEDSNSGVLSKRHSIVFILISDYLYKLDYSSDKILLKIIK